MSITRHSGAGVAAASLLQESIDWINSPEGAWSRTLEIICDEWGIASADGATLPIEIPNFGRNQLAELFHKLEFTRGAEIGVKRGEYSEVLLKANPALHLFGIDPYVEYQAYRTISQHQQNECRAEALERLAPYISGEFAGSYTLVERPSVEAAKWFKDGELQFIFLDGAHDFQNIANDLCEWSRVVCPGGLVVGHDYIARRHGRDGGPNTSHHVVPVVRAFTEAFQINPWFVLGRHEKREGEVRDKERSWLWIKQ